MNDTSSKPPGRETIDWSEALRSARGSEALVRTIAEIAREEVPRLVADIRRAVAEGDAVRLRLAAHTLKGSLRYFGKTAAFAQALGVEELARRGDLPAAAAALPQLEAEIERIVLSLSDYLQE
jgi:HPt (histidine-containing phosphotransfer) domain-containing protein